MRAGVPTPAVGRRALLAGLAGLGLGAGCAALSPITSAATAPSAPPVALRLRTDWSRHPTGPLPAAGDEGVPFVLRASGVPTPPRVDDGALVADLPDSRSAVYVDQDLGRPLRRLGARVGFLPGAGGRADDDGSLCLAAWSGALPPADPGVIEAPLHLVITPERWIHGVVTGSHLTTVASGRWTTPLPTDGTPVRVEAVLDGTRAVLTLPDGSTRQVDDPATGRLAARTACWEFYRHAPGGASIRLYETWAG